MQRGHWDVVVFRDIVGDVLENLAMKSKSAPSVRDISTCQVPTGIVLEIPSFRAIAFAEAYLPGRWADSP